MRPLPLVALALAVLLAACGSRPAATPPDGGDDAFAQIGADLATALRGD
jgi:hypothetical protein